MQNHIDRLIASLGSDFEAALVKTVPNRFYFLDFDADDGGTLLVFPDGGVFIIDSRYIEVATRQVKTAEVVLETDLLGQVKKLLADRGVKNLLVEKDITVGYYRQLQEALEGVTLIADDTLTDTIGSIREIKDSEEVSRIRTAQSIADACFTYICGELRCGMRQIDAALLMENYLRKNGAEGVSFPIIFISGADTSMPHGVPGEHTIKDGDFITMDFGAKVKGYCSDMTRTVAIGSVSSEMENIYQLVLQAQLAACDAAKAGVECSKIDAVARNIIKEGGYGEYFGHGLGHSLGIEVHENPRFSPRCHDITRAGQLMTIEPGIYLPGKFGVRIEDTVLLTEDGCENLATSTKNLIIL